MREVENGKTSGEMLEINIGMCGCILGETEQQFEIQRETKTVIGNS